MRRISVRSSFVSSPPGLLTDSTTAKAADRARRDHRAGGAWRIEHRATEVLFQPIGDIFPKLLDFFRRLAVRIDLHHRSAIDHRSGEIGALVQRHRSDGRSEEHTSELQSLMRISYAVFCLQKKTKYYSKREINKN